MSERPASDKNLQTAADGRTFIAPCKDLNPGATLEWLRLGWRDYWAVPRISLTWGLVIFLVSAAVTWLGWRIGGWVLVLMMLTGFVFVAPLVGFALYSVSRQLCMGKDPSLRKTLRAMQRPFQNSLLFSLLLMVIFLVWARAGAMVHIFFPVGGNPHWQGILLFLGIGSMVGAVFASVSFATTAFSLPFLANRDVDVVTAVVSSVNAVLRNKFTCAVWAITILVLTTVAIATALLGLIVVIPWLAYASWHAYQETLDVSAWETLPVVERNTGSLP